MSFADRIRESKCGCRYDVVTETLTHRCAKHEQELRDCQHAANLREQSA